jgi:GTP-binding protein HflX
MGGRLSLQADVKGNGNELPEGDHVCIVIHPDLSKIEKTDRSPEAGLQEGVGLALAIDINVVYSEIIRVNKPKSPTLLGSGAVERVRQIVAGQTDYCTGCDVVIINAALSPIQQRNLERTWQCKVVDRTGLILEIFGARAQTKEGRLQVDLAALSFQRSRLVRSWTHLERQRGGSGFMGGPGETQIESDRRLIDQQITQLKHRLKDVKRTRELHRKARMRVPYPIVALVGYTNAGKSSLFNRLTNAHVVVKDQLFATLDPTMRKLNLPSGKSIIMSDTVGFVSNLPHELVNAFHATLEEVMSADLIVHVRDASHTDTDAQKSDVLFVLEALGIDTSSENETFIEVLNKSDLLSLDQLAFFKNRQNKVTRYEIMTSAITGAGCDELSYILDQLITSTYDELDINLSHQDGATLAWLYEHGDVITRRDNEADITLTVRLGEVDAERLRRRLN